MITLIHGPTELLRAETLAAIRNGIADDPEMVELNTLRLDGRSATVADLRNACDALPFLAERRLVIAEGLLARLAAPTRGRGKAAAEPTEPEDEVGETALSSEVAKGQAKVLLTYLDDVPESTELVFLEEDTTASGPILRRLQELARSGQAKIVTCEKLRRNEVPDWIRQRAALRQVKLDAGALADLAEFVGDELRQLDQELLKLADYAPHRTVTREDVRKLVPATRAASVFEMADALGMGDGAVAGRLMRHALDNDGEQPLRLLGMIARQYRLLIQAKALQAQGVKPPEMARTLSVADWTVPKLLNQANRHTFAALERDMARILAADEAIKTGKLSDREAMDVLLAELLTGA
jgi:DNA polymerase-3 subunit delta